MPTASIDHIAIPTANAERLLEFYKRLGFPINNEEAWRAGGRGRGLTPSLSLYARDPDGNLLEWMTYQV